MLVEIRSNIFNEGVIKFHEGLNVVLGDDVGSNSIGKSTLLMILDFVFGGKTYLEHNADTIKELEHHTYEITFKFGKNYFYYMRDTNDKNHVSKCNKDFQQIDILSLDSYTSELKSFYELPCQDASFRSIVSLYSRVWGKENLIVDRPLHSYSSEKNYKTILNLIKLFNKYDELTELEKKHAALKKSRETLKHAGKLEYITLIGKRQFNSNENKLAEVRNEIEQYKQELEQMTISLSELVTEEIVALNAEKDRLVNEKGKYESKLKRIEFNSESKTRISKKKFEKLEEFFPNVNTEKLNNIESFHGGLTRILSNEIKVAKSNITINIEQLQRQITQINNQLGSLLNVENQPNYLIEKLIRLDTMEKQLVTENKFFNEKERLADDTKNVASQISEEKIKVLEEIEFKLNKKINDLNNSIHIENRRAPSIKLTPSNYTYNIDENTGTGKAYTNLILFDLAIFKLTPLPVVIHDSLLFKQIEVSTVDNIVNLYSEFSKQVFISIDETSKYSDNTQEILKKSCIQELSNSKLLFTKDWRNKN